MENIDIIKMSSKGQVVIPLNMRKDIKEGENLLVIRNKGQIIIKKASNLDKQLKEDLEFAERTEKAWKEIEEGKGVRMSVGDFFKELQELKKRK
ncbi:MAG: AbrB/MazE/SpoVT family DNA-binding domain-containing protein [Nanoarchaeota archaeon]